MRALPLIWGFIGVFGATFFRPGQTNPVRIVILGNHQGYLSPCGCSRPMLGGILRQAAIVRQIESSGATIVLDSGNISASHSEQEFLKAQALAETFKALKVTAINLSADDAHFSSGQFGSLQSLSGNLWLSSSIGSPTAFDLSSEKEEGGFIIGGISERGEVVAGLTSGDVVSENKALETLLADARRMNDHPVLMLDGSKDDAIRISSQNPQLAVIIYNSSSAPSKTPCRVGNTVLVSPGERGEYMIELTFSGQDTPDYRTITLGENVKNDPVANEIYGTYLRRVGDHHLWDAEIRVPGKPFAGTASCQSCHSADYKIWKASAHAGALHTLEKTGHQLDPECLKCHITGPEFKNGFRSLQSTPNLAFVGCESCHGPAADHVTNPFRFRLPIVKESTCVNCHELLNSPYFDYRTYWPKIRHGMGISSGK